MLCVLTGGVAQTVCEVKPQARAEEGAGAHGQGWKPYTIMKKTVDTTPSSQQFFPLIYPWVLCVGLLFYVK